MPKEIEFSLLKYTYYRTYIIYMYIINLSEFLYFCLSVFHSICPVWMFTTNLWNVCRWNPVLLFKTICITTSCVSIWMNKTIYLSLCLSIYLLTSGVSVDESLCWRHCVLLLPSTLLRFSLFMAGVPVSLLFTTRPSFPLLQRAEV